jgi:phospholipase D1/2
MATIQEATPLSGKFKELPSIPQGKPLGEGTTNGSDTFDFGSGLSSPVITKPTDAEASDYLNGGLPHEEFSPTPLPSSGTRAPLYLSPSEPIEAIHSPPETSPVPTTPVGRRSVQFARNDVVVPVPAAAGHGRNASWDARDTLGKIRSSSFVTKLKELAGPSGAGLSPRLNTVPPVSEGQAGSAATSPATSRPPKGRGLDEGSDIDADVEETAEDSAEDEPAREKKQKKKKRRMRRPKPDEQMAATPTTPRVTAESEMLSGSSGGTSRLRFIRRSTMPDPAEHRGGLSEGEGRERLTRGAGRTGSESWVPGRIDDIDEAESPSGRRVGHLRRISVFGGGVSDGDAVTPRRPFFTGERASTFGVQKWRQVKKTLKLLRQKKEDRFDYYKSAELMAELRAGAPAVLMLASMIQRDEHGNKRIPVLLEQLKLHIRDSTPVQEGDSERHWLFTMDLEYGSGPSRMKWTVKRTIREILNLHWKYKLAINNEKYLPNRYDLGTRPKQPKFPLSAFPYLRGVRGLEEDEDAAGDQASMRGADDTAGDTAAENTAGEYTATENEGRPPITKKKSRMNVLGGRRRGTGLGEGAGSNADFAHIAIDAAAARRRYVERQQRMLEKYLQEMIRWLMFRADSNRLCRFLELSALGVRLAAEGSYHGKECYLHIQSSKGLDFRRVLTPGKVIARHSRKWFLVRQSYIVCVESPENMNIYDVYLVDPKFKIISKKSKLKQITSSKSDMEEIDLTAEAPPEKHHTLKILTSER